MAVLTSTIRDRRRRLGISRLELALKAGVSTSWLAEIETGKRPNGEAYGLVVQALGRLEADREELAREEH
jgi:transcriptional regulator with XRE-family HTH domain